MTNSITLTANNIKINNRKATPRALSILNFMMQDPAKLYELSELIDNLIADGFTRGLSAPNMTDTVNTLIAHGIIVQPFKRTRIYKVDINTINTLIAEGV